MVLMDTLDGKNLKGMAMRVRMGAGQPDYFIAAVHPAGS